MNIYHWFTSVGHPQTNGEAEVMNRTILEDLHTKLDEANGRWMEELPNVLWPYHTMLQASTNEMPFSLAFGTKAVILMEIDLPTLRVE